MIIGYINSLSGNPDRQKQELKEIFRCDKIYTENDNVEKSRKELDRLLVDIRPGDTLCMSTIKSLPVSTLQLIELIEELYSAKEIELKTFDLDGKIQWREFLILSDFNRFFRRKKSMIGISSARARGRNGGRKEGLSEDAKKKADAAAKLYQAQTSIKDIMETLNFKSRATLYRYLRFAGVNI